LLKIYLAEFAKCFHDVSNGTNPGCGTLGFNATQGWDPVTGLGTPDFPSLLAKWLASKFFQRTDFQSLFDHTIPTITGMSDYLL
jgi:hypothetical protein